MLKYCLDGYETQEIGDKVVDTGLVKLKSWFILGLEVLSW